MYQDRDIKKTKKNFNSKRNHNTFFKWFIKQL